MQRTIYILSCIGIIFLMSFTAHAATIQYTYDNLNRLIKVEYANGNVIQYSYDQDGNRITQAVSVTGSITVTISPQGAVDAGAQWSVDGGAMETSGATVSDLSVGQHTISFGDVSGWTTPSSQTISVAAGQTTSVTGTYAQETGSLTVTISPSAAVSAGAQWNVDGGSWQTSGATVSDLSVGQHTVTFKISGWWLPPSPQTVTVSNGQTLSVTATYVQIIGSVSATISPAAAVTAGAKWNVDGGAWQDSGATVSDISPGQHTVVFSSISGWNTPASQTASIAPGQTASLSGAYVQQTGAISVTISPSAAVSAGAQWNVDGGSWNASGATVPSVTVGQHTVSFNNISGWATPASQTASISNGQTTSVTGTYVQTLNGACGSSSNGNFTTAPASNLCSSGTASSVTNNASGSWVWTCSGQNGGKNASCSANIEVSGACGSSNGSSFTSTPTLNLCSSGTASSVSGSGPWSWTCTGVNGGANASCSANLTVNGACGSSNGGNFASAPTANLCSAGTASSISGSGPWSWTCTGINGGSSANCSANLMVNGACGGSNGGNLTSAPASNLCNSGAASSVTGSGPWSWTCSGSNGGTNASCSANLEVNGACGAANGTAFLTAPTSNLCSSGTASSISGSGPWSWTCSGSNGGSTANCSANNDLWQNATATGGGWYYLSPFGAFSLSSSGWIYHQTLDWLYPVGTSTDSIWFYDPQWDGVGGWWWTSSSTFPWIYSVTESEWLYYDAKDSTLSTRWFFTSGGQASTH